MSSEWAETWTENTSAFDRVRSVTMALDEPRTAEWVAEQAHVAETTARGHLERLAEMGMLTTDTSGEAATYSPDPAYVRFRELQELVRDHSRADLVTWVADVKTKLEELSAEYDADSPRGLREQASTPDVSATTTRELLQAASDWDHYQYRLSLLNEAVERYDEYSGHQSPVSG